MMKNYMSKLWEKKDSKKGFTLVELIVVLVILAILAAIMVPALLGWIDRAKEKQIVLEGRNAYLAAQTLASEEYGSATPVKGNITVDRVVALADIVNGTVSNITYKSDNSVSRDDFTVTGITYTTSDKIAILLDGQWTITDTP